MKMITKLAVAAVFNSLAFSAFAAPTCSPTPASNTVGTTGTTISIEAATTATPCAAGDLSYGLKENVTLQLSAGNAGAVSTNATSTAYGYAVGSTKGKGRIYSGKSTGGAITETTLTGTTMPAAGSSGNVATQATTEAGS